MNAKAEDTHNGHYVPDAGDDTKKEDNREEELFKNFLIIRVINQLIIYFQVL